MALTKVNALTVVGISDLQPSDDFVIRDHGTAPGSQAARRISYGVLDSRWKELPALGAAREHLAINAAGDAVEWVAPPTAGATAFIGLTDTPGSLGSAGQIVAVATGGTTLEFITPTSGGATTLLGLTDTPAAFGTAGQVLQVNQTTNGVVWGDKGTSGAGTFLALGDTPAAFTGQGGNSLRVNAGATALEYYTPANDDGALDWRN